MVGLAREDIVRRREREKTKEREGERERRKSDREKGERERERREKERLFSNGRALGGASREDIVQPPFAGCVGQGGQVQFADVLGSRTERQGSKAGWSRPPRAAVENARSGTFLILLIPCTTVLCAIFKFEKTVFLETV